MPSFASACAEFLIDSSKSEHLRAGNLGVGAAIIALRREFCASLPSPTNLLMKKPPEDSSMAQINPTVILVHGAWADGSSWMRVIPGLREKGINVIAVQLPLTSLAEDTATVRRAIELQAAPIVLVGHSYGGAVITEAGNDPKVRELVYVAAFAPSEGQSAASLGATIAPPPLAEEVNADSEGFLRLSRRGIQECFAQDLDDAEKTVLFATQSPINVRALTGAISEAAWRQKPSWYVIASEDRAINPDLEAIMAEKIGANTISVSSSHVPMLSHPEAIAQVIEKAVYAKR